MKRANAALVQSTIKDVVAQGRNLAEIPTRIDPTRVEIERIIDAGRPKIIARDMRNGHRIVPVAARPLDRRE